MIFLDLSLLPDHVFVQPHDYLHIFITAILSLIIKREQLLKSLFISDLFLEVPEGDIMALHKGMKYLKLPLKGLDPQGLNQLSILLIFFYISILAVLS